MLPPPKRSTFAGAAHCAQGLTIGPLSPTNSRTSRHCGHPRDGGSLPAQPARERAGGELPQPKLDA